MKVRISINLNEEMANYCGGHYCVMVCFDDEPVEEKAVKALRARKEG